MEAAHGSGIVYNALSKASGPSETVFVTLRMYRPHARAATDRPPAHAAKAWGGLAP